MPTSARRLGLLPLGLAVLLAGCGAPPAPDRPAGPNAPPTVSPSGAAPSLPSLPPGQPGPTGPGFGEEMIAISCAGQPAAAELLDLLQAEGLLGAGTEVQVLLGPLCAGGWQYTVVSVPDLDPLQVVTRGEAGGLELVTAGTDVCTVEVRVRAPAGIRDAATCLA